MKIGLKLDGLGGLRQALSGLTSARAGRVYADAMNDTGFHVRPHMQQEYRDSFDRPTEYIIRSPRVQKATPQRLVVAIEPTYMGGKGIDPQQILQAQEHGGTRRDKRSEVALRRVGILPAGFQTSIPATPFPGSDDGRGNLRGPFLVQLISYLQAFGEQGYKANMTERRKAAVHRGKQIAGPVQPGRKRMTDGRRYFVSYGRLRADRTSHLPPGIWAAMGTHGVDVRPVLMFVAIGDYRPRLNMSNVERRAAPEPYLQKRLRYRIRQAVGA